MPQIFTDLWEMAKQGSPFATCMLLAILYFINEERRELIKENQSLHEKNAALVERLLGGLNEVNNAIKELSNFLFNAGRARRR